MISSAHKKIPCLFSGTKRQQKPRLCIYKATNVATDRLKEILQTPSDKPYSIVLDLDETVLDNSPYQVQNVKDGTAFNPKDWDVWVKSSRKSSCQVPKIFFNMRIKTGFKSTTFLTVQPSQVDDTIKNLEKKAFLFKDVTTLMFLEDGVKSKEGRRQAVQEKTNLVLLFGDNLVDFADFPRPLKLIATRNWTNCKKNLVKNSSSSQIQCMDHGNLLFTKVKTRCQRDKQKNASKPCKVLTNKANIPLGKT